MLHTQNFSYQDGHLPLEGFLAFDDARRSKKPLVLIVHDWTGCTPFVRKKAEKLAYSGYVGFAVDMYGRGQTGTTNEEKSALMQPLISDRKLIIQRLQAALDAVKKIELVDHTRIAIAGYCFGGLCALDLARQSDALLAAVSFHGRLSRPENLPAKPITAKILALHGHDDPMVPPSQVADFEMEMTAAQADWQLTVYGNAMHAFTNPEASDPAFGTVYNALADRRSWVAMENFLHEVLKQPATS